MNATNYNNSILFCKYSLATLVAVHPFVGLSSYLIMIRPEYWNRAGEKCTD